MAPAAVETNSISLLWGPGACGVRRRGGGHVERASSLPLPAAARGRRDEGESDHSPAAAQYSPRRRSWRLWFAVLTSLRQWPTSGTRSLMTFENPAPSIFPNYDPISEESSAAVPGRWSHSRLFMLSFWCGEYLCRTDDNRIICASEVVQIYTQRQLFSQGES